MSSVVVQAPSIILFVDTKTGKLSIRDFNGRLTAVDGELEIAVDSFDLAEPRVWVYLRDSEHNGRDAITRVTLEPLSRDLPIEPIRLDSAAIPADLSVWKIGLSVVGALQDYTGQYLTITYRAQTQTQEEKQVKTKVKLKPIIELPGPDLVLAPTTTPKPEGPTYTPKLAADGNGFELTVSWKITNS